MRVRIKPLILLSILLLVVAGLLSNTESKEETLGDIFKELGIFIEGIDDFIVQKSIVREGDENTFWTVVAEKNGRRVKLEVIENIGGEDAQNYSEERRSIIEALYKNMSSPYPGMVSKAIECSDEFKPKVIEVEIEERHIPVYILSSTPRFTYGACVEELIQYRGVLAFIYAEEKKTLYRIELFIPKGDFNKEEAVETLRSFTCKGQHQAGQSEALKHRDNRKNVTGYNLIIVGIEPLGAEHVSVYGYFRKTTPHLDNFSKNAIVFKNAVSPSSWTLPAFMSWFTSLYPSQHGITNKYSTYTRDKQIIAALSELSPSVVTLAQVLKGNGYSTAGFTGDAGVSGEFGYSLGFDVYYDQTAFGGFDITLPRALDWLRSHKEDRFFLFVQGYDVHGRSGCASSPRSMFFNPNYQGHYEGTPEEYWELRNANLDQEFFHMEDEDVQFWREWYDGKVYEADKKLRMFLKELDTLGIANRTVIVVSSASGNEFYEHKRFDHGHSLYDELILVPLIIKIPGVNGRVIENQVRTIDIMPTVLDLLGVRYDETVKEQMQGVSLVPLIEGKDLQLDAFSETDYLLQTFKRSLRRHDGWKFIYTMEIEKRELYNIREDPQELHNMIEKKPTIAHELEQRLFNWLTSMGQDKYHHRNVLKSTLEQKTYK